MSIAPLSLDTLLDGATPMAPEGSTPSGISEGSSLHLVQPSTTGSEPSRDIPFDLSDVTDRELRRWSNRLLRELDPGETMKDLATTANIIAAAAHDGQTDKAGAPYITHPARVAAAARDAAPDHLAEQAEAVDWLHDVVEDTSITIEQLREQGFPEPVLAGVDAMTKRRGEPVEDYFARVRANALARIVKKADLDDNTNPERLDKLDAGTRARLTTKYQRARALLTLADSAQ